MDVEWVTTVQARVMAMSRYLDELEQRLPPEETSYLSDRDRQLAVERLCQLIVECAIDANALLLTDLGQPPPASARDGFDGVEQLGVLDAPLAQRFRTTFVGFRHRLVHGYERLDNRIVYRTAQQLLDAGRRYIAAVTAFLTRQP